MGPGVRRLGVLEQDEGLGVAQLLTAVEAGDLQDEEVADDVASELLDEVGGSLGRATLRKS